MPRPGPSAGAGPGPSAAVHSTPLPMQFPPQSVPNLLRAQGASLLYANGAGIGNQQHMGSSSTEQSSAERSSHMNFMPQNGEQKLQINMSMVKFECMFPSLMPSPLGFHGFFGSYIPVMQPWLQMPPAMGFPMPVPVTSLEQQAAAIAASAAMAAAAAVQAPPPGYFYFPMSTSAGKKYKYHTCFCIQPKIHTCNIYSLTWL